NRATTTSVTFPVTFSGERLRNEVNRQDKLSQNQTVKTKSRLLWASLILATIHSTLAQPMIVQQPQNQTNIVGTTATFAVAVVSSGGAFFQWRSYANAIAFTNIPRADNATFVLSNVQPTTRLFGVEITDGSGLSVTSSLASLTVVGITSQPMDQIVEVVAT